MFFCYVFVVCLFEVVHLKTCWTLWHIRYFRSKKLCCPQVQLQRVAAHSAIAVAAAAVVASERSPKGSPCSCLACSDGIPGSVPSDCRLAPLPPSLTYTHKPAPSIVASSSSLLRSGAALHLHVHNSPCDHRLFFPLRLTLNFPTILHLLLLAVLGLSPVWLFFLFLLPSFVSRMSVWFKRDTKL